MESTWASGWLLEEPPTDLPGRTSEIQTCALCRAEIWPLSIRSRVLANAACQRDWTNRCPEHRDHVISGCVCEGVSRGDSLAPESVD